MNRITKNHFTLLLLTLCFLCRPHHVTAGLEDLERFFTQDLTNFFEKDVKNFFEKDFVRFFEKEFRFFFEKDVKNFFERDVPVFFTHQVPESFKVAGGKIEEFFVQDIPKVFQNDVKNFFEVQLADVINANFVDKFIDRFEPELQDVVNKTLDQAKKGAITSIHGIIAKEMVAIINKEYPGEEIIWIKQRIYLPLKAKTSDIVEHYYYRFISIITKIIEDTELFVIRDIKNALKLYFGLGNNRQHRDIKVRPTCDGIFGFVQLKVEQLHADIAGELLPSLEGYVKGLQPKLMLFIEKEAVTALLATVGTLANFEATEKAIKWLVNRIMQLFNDKLYDQLVNTYSSISVLLNKSMRKAFYQLFWFLTDHVDVVHAQLGM